MGTNELMGKDKVRMSAKFIMGENFVSEALQTVGNILSTDDNEGILSPVTIDALFEKLKNEEPEYNPLKGKSEYVVDFLVFLNFIKHGIFAVF